MATSLKNQRPILIPQPNQFQLALALAIAKTKPPDISIRDYVLRLRQHISSGSRDQSYGSSQEYLNGASYWHGMFTDSQVEIHELQSKNLQLEKTINKLRSESRSTDLDEVVVKRTAKRKQDETKLRASSRPHKKNSGKKDPNSTSTKAGDILVDDFKILDVPGPGSTTVLHLYRAHKLYQQIEPDLSVLAYHLTEAASNLVRHVSTIAQQIQQQQLDVSLTQDRRLRAQLTANVTSKIDTELPGVLRAAGRSFISLLHGLSTLWHKGTDAARRQHGATTYTYIQTVDKLLSTITSTCLLIAKQNVAASQLESSSSTPNAQKHEQTKVQKVKRMSKPQIPEELTALLLALLTHLTPAPQGEHTALYEGILYLLLERTGEQLFTLTFGHERSAAVEGDINASDHLDPSHTSSPLANIERKAASIEVKFLVKLLERAMNLAPAFLGSVSGATSSKTSRAGKSSVVKNAQPKTSLSISAKEKLQRTLVQCMFGEDEKRKDNNNSDTEDEDKVSNNEFIELLRKPLPMGPLPQPPKIEDLEVPQWFREEIWRLIGWDILGREERDWAW